MTEQRELLLDLATPLERAEAHLKEMARRYEKVVERVYGRPSGRNQEAVGVARANYIGALKRVEELRRGEP